MSKVSSSPERKAFPIPTPDSHRDGRGTTASTNQHPYAIKTTSTALLTRSNSSGFVASHQHLYIPTTPTPSPSKHRHTRSDLTQARPSPRPLPIPPSFESPSKPTRKSVAADGIFSMRTRAETLPTVSNPSLPSPMKADDLPSNPRVWTTSQLASYLVSALRVRCGSALPLPLPVAKDVALFIKQQRFTGRAFLRLSEQDLEQMEINNLWRDALLNASRNLRANVLKGRIWGFEADNASEPSPIYPFRSRYNSSSSSSSIDESLKSDDTTPQKDGSNSGRVRRAVASLERSSSSGSGFSNRGSSTSDGELAHGAFSEDEASFASGSEASMSETSRTRNATKKRILSDSSEKQVAVEVVAQEPSVEELLETDNLSSSWGVKVWEEMKVGDTVKCIGAERPADNAALTSQADMLVTSPALCPIEVDGETKVELLNAGESKAQITDMLSKALPARPLPSPPQSGTASPIPRRLITGLPVEIVEKVEQGVQVDSPRTPSDVGNTTITGMEKEELKEALAQLELYKKRLEETEAKLMVLEQQQETKAEYSSRSVGTDSITGSLPVKSDRESEDGPPSLGRGQALNNTKEESLSSADDAVTWRDYVSRPDWNPLEKGVPTYVLMVGMGVCVVVLSTLVKRFAGKKA